MNCIKHSIEDWEFTLQLFSQIRPSFSKVLCKLKYKYTRYWLASQLKKIGYRITSSFTLAMSLSRNLTTYKSGIIFGNPTKRLVLFLQKEYAIDKRKRKGNDNSNKKSSVVWNRSLNHFKIINFLVIKMIVVCLKTEFIFYDWNGIDNIKHANWSCLELCWTEASDKIAKFLEESWKDVPLTHYYYTIFLYIIFHLKNIPKCSETVCMLHEGEGKQWSACYISTISTLHCACFSYSDNVPLNNRFVWDQY